MQEKAKREERERLKKEAKAAEAQKKQADAKRLAGERAEEREKEKKRKQEQASQVQPDLQQVHKSSQLVHISLFTVCTLLCIYICSAAYHHLFFTLPSQVLPFVCKLCLTCITLPLTQICMLPVLRTRRKAACLSHQPP